MLRPLRNSRAGCSSFILWLALADGLPEQRTAFQKRLSAAGPPQRHILNRQALLGGNLLNGFYYTVFFLSFQ